MGQRLALPDRMNVFAPPRARILVVHPQPHLLVEALAMLGHLTRVDGETDGCALAIIAVGIPGLDGLRAAWSLRQRAATLPLLALLPEENRELRLQALGAGLDDTVSLPLDPAELRIRIRTLLRAGAAPDLERQVLIRDDRTLAQGTLVGGVSHDLCNVSVRLQFAIAELEDAGAEGEPIELLRGVADDLTRRARQLGRIARRARSEPAEELDLHGAVLTALAELVELGPLGQVELQVHAPEEQLAVHVEAQHVTQLVGNLAVGALESITDLSREGRAISVRIEPRGTEWVALRVEGVRPEGNRDLARPGSAPRPLGLGIAAVQALAAACGGRCALEPTGTRRHVLTVLLPRAAAHAGDASIHAVLS
jgi:DNA-binding response OmpR family regulator